MDESAAIGAFCVAAGEGDGTSTAFVAGGFEQAIDSIADKIKINAFFIRTIVAQSFPPIANASERYRLSAGSMPPAYVGGYA